MNASTATANAYAELATVAESLNDLVANFEVVDDANAMYVQLSKITIQLESLRAMHKVAKTANLAMFNN